MALTKVSGDFIKAGSVTQAHLHSSHGITTSHLTEGDKLFFTNARVDSRIGSLSSSDLSEGTNLYYTDARARAAISGTGSLSYNSTTGVMSFTMPAQNTSNITEGSNLYYTDARADARVALIVDSAPGTLNTLNELAAALGDDANFATTTANSIGTKWTQDNAKITNWDTAYGWGDHGSGGYAADSAVVKLTGNQTISGTKTFYNNSIVISGSHGTISFMDTTSGEDNFYLHANSNNFYILVDRDATDAIDGGYESPHPLQLEGDTNTAYVFGSALNIGNWNTAYGWGNHASAGYLTSYTEADTLATVTGRGASTSNNIAINAGASYPLQTSSSQRYGIQIRNTNNTVNSAYGWWWGTDTNFDMFFHCDGGSDRFTLTRQGEATAFASMSAPIYYDRNDTAYYVNPASRSNIGDLDLNSGAVWDATTQGTGKGSLHLDPNSGTDHAGAAITFGASDASNGGNAQAGIYIRSDGSYGTKMYFATTDSYATGSKTSMNILENGQVNITRNNLIVNSDVRGTVFYDSNNTTYFLNPSASGGNALNTIGDWRQTSDSWSGEVGGKMQYHGNHWYLQATGYVHFRNASGTNTFYVDQNGTGYINDYLTGANSMRAPIFYDSNDTGYYVNPNSTSVLSLVNHQVGVGVNQSGSQSSAHGVSLYGTYTGGVPTYGMLFTGTSSQGTHGAVTDGWATFFTMNDNNARGWIFRKVGGANTSSISAGGVATFDDSVRSPIYYDSNNTGYYTNPLGTSRTNTIDGNVFSGNISTTGDGQNNYPFRLGSDYNAYMVAAASNTWGLFWAGNAGARYGTNGNGGPGNIWGNSGNPNEFCFVGSDSTKWTIYGNDGRSWQAGYATNAASYRAPIFYDSNNTGYYVDPASTSRLLNLDFGVSGYYLKAGDWGTRQQTPYGWIQLGPANTSHAHIYTDRSNFYFNQQIQLNGGSLINTNDIRAGIFYDVNNTGYYVDPASKSFVSTIHFNGSVSGSGAGSEIGRNHAYDTAELKGYGAELMIGAQHTEININYRTCNGGVSGHTPTTWKWRAGTSSNWSNHYMGLIESSNSMRAPIFYDSNDTGYYTDPASTSSLKLLKTGQNHQANAPRWDTSFYVAQSQHYYAHSSTQTMYVGESNTVNIRSVGIASGSFRAPIFYDSNNTAYYTRPASSSYINTLHTAGQIQVGASGSSLLYIGGTSGNYFRFHTNNADTYFDMNCGNIHWRQGSSTRFIFYSTTANMTVYGTVTQHSDLRIKDNVVEIPNCIDKVKSIRGIYYNRTDFNTEPTKIGVVAQEVEVEMPELVHDEETSGIKSVSYTELTAVLVNAIKEQQTIIDDLKSRLETLENQ